MDCRGPRTSGSHDLRHITGQAIAKVQALALRVVAERLEHGEAGPQL